MNFKTGKIRKTILSMLLSLSAFSVPAAAQEPPEDGADGHRAKPGPPPVVAKGPCKKVEGKFVTGMKLYLMTDHRLIGEVTAYRPSHLFQDGKSREAVKLKLADGKNTWLPADTARRIYVTQ
jgi:hypothetical protein